MPPCHINTAPIFVCMWTQYIKLDVTILDKFRYYMWTQDRKQCSTRVLWLSLPTPPPTIHGGNTHTNTPQTTSLDEL